MQLMPATAKWVAKKIGLRDYNHSQVNNTETNVLLGTSYMRLVMENLDNHPVLASAAYNAGPGRAKKWRADRPLEGAIYAETIPFAETREFLAGFNLIEAADIDEAMRIAHAFPWSQFGSIEVRPVRDMQAVRTRVGAP